MSDFEFDVEQEMETENEPAAPRARAAAEESGTDPYSLQARKKVRDQLQNDVEAFLQRGGHVQQIADNVRADPPRKPSTDYGSAPI